MKSWRDHQFAQARREVEVIVAALTRAINDVDSPQGGDRRLSENRSSDVSDPTLAAALSRNEVREGARKWLRDLTNLANAAKRRWPPVPKAGEVVDGVKVLESAPLVEVCSECRTAIGGGSADPLTRIDGKPYHRIPCAATVHQRRRRRESRDAISPE